MQNEVDDDPRVYFKWYQHDYAKCSGSRSLSFSIN